MPRMARQAPSSAAHSAGGTCDSVMRPSIPNCAGSRPASRTSWWSPIDDGLRLGPRAEVGHPAIGQARGAPHDHLALAPHPDRDAPPRRQRIDPRVGNAMPLPVERHQLLGPERAHDRDLLLDALAAILEVLAQRLELDGVPADAHAEPQAPARQHVDGGRLLGDERGLPLREDQDARRQPQSAGHAGEKAEQHERLVERVAMGIRALPAARPLGVRPQDMVEGEHMGIAHPLDGLRIVADPRRIRSDLDLWEHDPDVHWPLLDWRCVTSSAALAHVGRSFASRAYRTSERLR